MLFDVDVVLINIDYVVKVGFMLVKDVIVIEDLCGLYVNLIVVCV